MYAQAGIFISFGIPKATNDENTKIEYTIVFLLHLVWLNLDHSIKRYPIFEYMSFNLALPLRTNIYRVERRMESGCYISQKNQLDKFFRDIYYCFREWLLGKQSIRAI